MEIRTARQEDLKEIFALRFEVFVDEQNVPAQIELDEFDAEATHIIAKQDEITVGCARLIFTEKDAHIGRLAVKKDFRNNGIGTEICNYIIEHCRNKGYKCIWLNSQIKAVGFYQKLGFDAVGEHFYEAGIEHVKMQITQ